MRGDGFSMVLAAEELVVQSPFKTDGDMSETGMLLQSVSDNIGHTGDPLECVVHYYFLNLIISVLAKIVRRDPLASFYVLIVLISLILLSISTADICILKNYSEAHLVVSDEAS
nr:hypothetical protein Iba_chr06cCG12210 [Ipomoea batatas]